MQSAAKVFVGSFSQSVYLLKSKKVAPHGDSLTPGSRAGLELRSSGKPVAVQPIVKSAFHL